MKPANATIIGLMGLAVFGAGIVMFIAEGIFIWRASRYEGVIVDVSYEYVPAGRGSKKAYVPIVDVKTATGQTVRVKVDAHDESPVYKVGDSLDLSCTLGNSPLCDLNTFNEMWFAPILTTVLGLIGTFVGYNLWLGRDEGSFTIVPS